MDVKDFNELVSFYNCVIFKLPNEKEPWGSFRNRIIDDVNPLIYRQEYMAEFIRPIATNYPNNETDDIVDAIAGSVLNQISRTVGVPSNLLRNDDFARDLMNMHGIDASQELSSLEQENVVSLNRFV